MNNIRKIFATMLVMCIIGSVIGAAKTSDGTTNQAVTIDSAGHVKHVGKTTTSDATTGAVSFTSLQIDTANAVSTPVKTNKVIPLHIIDNSKKIAVYIPSRLSIVDAEGSGTIKTTVTDATYDPYCTAMLYEYDLRYLSDTTIESQLTKSNYDLLVIPMCEMAPNAAIAINKYLDSGGSVWFMNDPSLTEDNIEDDDRITILGGATYSDNSYVNGASVITITSDDLTANLPSTFSPIGTQNKWSFFRSLIGSGVIDDFNYKVLMNNNDCAMMIKFENSTTGGRAIYSNINMYVSGGACSYFDAQTATKLFLLSKAWLLKLDMNTAGVGVTFPTSDKQFTITLDDMMASSKETPRPFFDMEIAHGINPANANTFFIVPVSGITNKDGLHMYSDNGDTHALHYHSVTDWSNSQSIAIYTKYINDGQSIINKAAGISNRGDYGFTSWRFPMTSYCLNSQKAVVKDGFMIDSSNGRYTDGVAIGVARDNNLMFPKQMLLNNVVTNTIEMELTSYFDSNTENGDAFAQKVNVNMINLQNVNFPSDFVIGGHYQYSMLSPDYMNGMSQILDASKAAGTSYSTFDDLARYTNGVKHAKISATTVNGVTTITVTPTTTIKNFTIKVANQKVVYAKCDKTVITPKQDKTVSYIISDISKGTHTFTIVTA